MKLSIFSILMVLTAGLLFAVAGNPLLRLDLFESTVVNRVLNYQLSALVVAGLALLVTFVFAGEIRLGYLNLNRSGSMAPIFGRSGGGKWEADAWIIASIMALIVGVVTFFQFLPSGFAFHWAYVALVIPFAATNAFTEEVIFRLSYVTMGDNYTHSRAYGLVMGSMVFGVIHYWGLAPNGVTGAAMSAFLGFILAKSIQETKGFYWAFTIHFVLDIPIMLFVLNHTP